MAVRIKWLLLYMLRASFGNECKKVYDEILNRIGNLKHTILLEKVSFLLNLYNLYGHL